MNPSRPLFSIAACGVAACGLALSTFGQAAPQSPRTLSFNVTARINSPMAGEDAQIVSSKVWSKGNHVRLETILSDRATVFLLSPPYVYKLIPSAKAGVRWKNTKSQLNGVDLQALLRNPAFIRALLQSRGAKKISAGKLNGTPVEIFTARDLMGQKGTAKAWLRQSDALPLRLEIKSKSLSGAVSWKNYKRDAPLSDALFRVPTAYKVRDSQSASSGF